VLPGTTVAVPFVFVTETSYWMLTLSVSLAELFAESVSPVAETVAVFVNVLPVASGFTFATTVYVSDPPGRSLVIVSETLPVCPVRPFPDHDQDETHVGCESLTDIPVAVIGPLLVTTIDQVVVAPGVIVETPLLLLTETSKAITDVTSR
jgi:hypothetical protein